MVDFGSDGGQRLAPAGNLQKGGRSVLGDASGQLLDLFNPTVVFADPDLPVEHGVDDACLDVHSLGGRNGAGFHDKGHVELGRDLPHGAFHTAKLRRAGSRGHRHGAELRQIGGDAIRDSRGEQDVGARSLE